MLVAVCAEIARATPGLAATQSACPASDLSLSTVATYTTTAAALDSSYLLNRLQFDLVAGILSLDYCCSINPTYMNARDAYDVIGVPAGTPVSLSVEVPVSGEIYDSGGCGGSGCGGSFYASIDHGAEHAQYLFSSPPLYYGARASFSGTAQLPLTIVAGLPETVSFQFWARRALGGSHGAHAQGVIRFTGLPAGASIVSCQGFAGQITPVLRTSWGGLKTIYR
jgi:hypothetical protein